MAAELRRQMPRSDSRRGLTDLESWGLSALVCAVAFAWLLSLSSALEHWFVVPTFACGVVIGKDAVDWARARLGTLDPAAVLGLFGWHFFFLSPLLTAYYGQALFWWAITPPRDWRDWLGYLAIANFAGLFVYRLSRSAALRWRASARSSIVWVLDRRRFWWLWALLVVACSIFVVLVFRKVGGYVGYAAARAFTPQTRTEHPLYGMGWMTTFAERLPMILWLGFVVYLSGRARRPTWWAIGAGLVVLFALQLAIAGPRGSRSAVMFTVIEAVIMVHYVLRPVSRRIIMAGLAATVAFVYYYGFYKAAGLAGLEALRSPGARAEITTETGRGVQKVLIDDLSRAGIQSYLIYRVTRPTSDYDYAFGRSYLAALSQPVPRSIWPDKPPAKHYETAVVLFGRPFADTGGLSHKVLGLAGEALLNFSPLAIPLAFVVPGVLVAAVRRWGATWRRDDARMLLMGMLVPLAVRVVHGDSSNLTTFFARYGVTVLPLILLSVHRVRIGPAGAGAGRPAEGSSA